MPTPRAGYYNSAGERIPGVTTIIGGVKLGGIEQLLAWANREGLAGRNHRETRDKAADAGTAAHAMVEARIRGRPFDASEFKPDALEKAQHAFAAFLAWADQTQLQPAEPETGLISEVHQYGGTLDAMMVHGHLALGDWKTSSGVYVDHLMQLAAYGTLWAENHPERPITGGYHLIRFAKPAHPDDPVHFAHHHWSNLDVAWEAFKHCRELYELNKRLRKLT